VKPLRLTDTYFTYDNKYVSLFSDCLVCIMTNSHIACHNLSDASLSLSSSVRVQHSYSFNNVDAAIEDKCEVIHLLNEILCHNDTFLA